MTGDADSRAHRWAVPAVVVLIVVALGVVWALTRHHSTTSPSSAPSTTPVARHTPSASGHSRSSSGPSPSLGTSFTPGSGQTVPDRPAKTRPAVPLRSTAPFGTGLSVRIVGITPVQGHATEPGEVGGPALRIQIVAHNSSARPIPLDGTTVFVSYGSERTPAEELSQGEHRFTGSVPAHGSRSATYVFQVPPSDRGDVRVQVSYAAKAPVVALEGAA
jgi:hypothetical protein